MSVIIRLQNLPLTASAMDIRVFFHGLSIPDGGVHIVGGKDGDAFIAFSSDEDARQAMNLSGQKLKDCFIKLLLSSRNEMFKVIEQARQGPSGADDKAPSTSPQPQNHAVNTSLGETGLNSPSNNSLDFSNNALNSANGKALSSMNMIMPGFPGGVNMNLPNAMAPFQNMKFTPQQLSQLAAMQGLFPQQAAMGPGLGQTPNPFLNMGLAATGPVPGGPNSLLQSNPLAFPGLIPGMGIAPGIMNQPPPSLVPNGNQQQPMGPNPFAQNGMRMNQMGNINSHHGFNNVPNPNIMQGGQQNIHNTIGPIRPNFNQSMDDFNRNRFNQNNDTQQAFGGLPFRPNVTSAFEQNRDRVVNQNAGRDRDRVNLDRDRRDREPMGDLNKVGRIERRRSDSVEKRDAVRERERRRRSRSRERERSRRDGRKSRSRSRSRDRSIRGAERPNSSGSGRRNSARGESRDKSLGDIDARNTSTSDPDILIIDEKPGPSAESACVMLWNISNDATYRDIREFLRAETRNYGIMRDFDNFTACVRLDKPVELESVLRKNGRKLFGEAVRIEIVPLSVFEEQAKRFGQVVQEPRPAREDRNKERPPTRDFAEREKDRERDFRFREREREPRDPRKDNGDCCLVIYGLPVSFNGSDVANITLDGVIKTLYSDIHIHEEPAERNGRQFATAFVKFHSFPEAERAIGLISKTQGDHLRARITDIEELEKIRQGVLPPPMRLPNDAKPLFELDVELDSPNVMLKGTPLTMSERDVFDFFSDIGLSPKRVKLLTDAQTGNRINKVICEFDDIPQARRAVSKDGQFFGRATISVRMLPRRDLKGPPSFPQRGGRSGAPLGNRPPGPGGFNSHFVPNLAQSENPFVQALNQVSAMASPDISMRGVGGMRGGAVRGRGIAGRGRGGGIRSSRFTPADSTTVDGIHNNNEAKAPTVFERKGCVLGLTNIPFGANMDQIIIFLEENLERLVPHDRIIRRYNEFQKPTGDARIAFDNHYETKQSLERLQGARMWGRQIEATIVDL